MKVKDLEHKINVFFYYSIGGLLIVNVVAQTVIYFAHKGGR